jgi:hypothetical protein
MKRVRIGRRDQPGETAVEVEYDGDADNLSLTIARPDGSDTLDLTPEQAQELRDAIDAELPVAKVRPGVGFDTDPQAR